MSQAHQPAVSRITFLDSHIIFAIFQSSGTRLLLCNTTVSLVISFLNSYRKLGLITNYLATSSIWFINSPTNSSIWKRFSDEFFFKKCSSTGNYHFLTMSNRCKEFICHFWASTSPRDFSGRLPDADVFEDVFLTCFDAFCKWSSNSFFSVCLITFLHLTHQFLQSFIFSSFRYSFKLLEDSLLLSTAAIMLLLSDAASFPPLLKCFSIGGKHLFSASSITSMPSVTFSFLFNKLAWAISPFPHTSWRWAWLRQIIWLLFLLHRSWN